MMFKMFYCFLTSTMIVLGKEQVKHMWVKMFNC